MERKQKRKTIWKIHTQLKFWFQKLAPLDVEWFVYMKINRPALFSHKYKHGHLFHLFHNNQIFCFSSN